MEELRSTEVLEREILEDARKKARKILSAADDRVIYLADSWGKKTEKDIADLSVLYDEREKKAEEEILARLPLDKRRLRSEITENFLQDALKTFLSGLSRQDSLRTIEMEFLKRIKTCALEIAESKTKPVLHYNAMNGDEAQKIINKAMSAPELKDKFQWEKIEDAGIAQDAASSSFPSLFLDTSELKITVSLEDTAGDLLKEKRAELADALLGGGVLND